MHWSAREGLLSIFAIFAANAVTYMGFGKSLPYTAEAMTGIVGITVAAVGVVTARGWYNDKQAWQNAGQPGVTVNYTAGSAPSTVPPK